MADVVKPSKHGRDHCPGGEDPIPCLGGPISFRGEQWANFPSITSGGGWQILLFDEYSNPDESVFDFDGVGDDLSGVIGLKLGLYTVQFSWQWGPSFTATEHGGAIGDNMLVWQDVAIASSRVTSATDYTISMTKSYPSLEYLAGHGSNVYPRFDFSVTQNSGSGRGVQGRFEVIYWGPCTVGDTIVGT